MPVANPVTLVGNWKVEFLDGGPVLPTATSAASLTSWTEWGTDELKNFSGSAKYSLSFDRPAAKATRYLLDLATVHETAEIILNGKPLSTLIGPSFQTWIPASLLKQRNTIEIIVSNLMANRIAYMDRNNMPWKIFYNTNMPARKKENVKDGLFNASAWKPLPSGLIGPVTITPCK